MLFVAAAPSAARRHSSGSPALVLAALALVPVVGYVEGVVVPLLGLRIRRRAAERYAGLRTLAK